MLFLCRERTGAGFEYAVYFLPRRTIACEKIFQEEGIYGDIVVGEYPLGFIPHDFDLLSLELGSAYRVGIHPSQYSLTAHQRGLAWALSASVRLRSGADMLYTALRCYRSW
jgi:hypothetical protein